MASFRLIEAHRNVISSQAARRRLSRVRSGPLSAGANRLGPLVGRERHQAKVASKPVPASRAEGPLSVRPGDLPLDAHQRARRADSEPSASPREWGRSNPSRRSIVYSRLTLKLTNPGA